MTEAPKKPRKKGSGGPRPGAGRPKSEVRAARRELIDAAKEYAPQALKVLIEVAQDKDAPPSARVSAANGLLDRGYGRPHQAVDINSNVNIVDLSRMSDKALDEYIAGLESEYASTGRPLN